VSSPTDTQHDLRFEHLDARIRTAVEEMAGTDPNPSDPFRGLYVSDDMARALASQPQLARVDAPLDEAARLLELSPLETAVLALCAAPELGANYGRLFGYLHDDVTRKLASPRLTVRLLAQDGVSEQSVWKCFDARSALRRAGAVLLLDANGTTPLADRPVKVHDRLVDLLLGTRVHDDNRARVVRPPGLELGRGAAAEELRAVLRDRSQTPIVITGPDAAELLAAALGRSLIVVDAAGSVDRDTMSDASLQATLEGHVLCFDGFERADPDDARRRLAALSRRDQQLLLFATDADALVAHMPGPAFVVRVPPPGLAERLTAWEQVAPDTDVDDVAAKFRLSVTQIAAAGEAAQLAAQAAARARPLPEDLDRGARLASARGLAELAAALDRVFTWDDLVLPDRQLEVLHSVSAFLRHRDLVLSEWGYERTVARNQGLKVLFAGESGTGKTMAAQVLAADLGLDLFRIDLATTVSKYIGETEKNLDRIFAAAEGSNAILFFDEADALFGRRSDVRDSHDRYANIEVAYLLQRMDSYPGAVILATNFRQNIDDAFLRRLDFLVDFPFPEPADRLRIWRLVLPGQAPTAGDVDLEFLANQFKLAGGNIRNASLAAAFLAADEAAPIGMRHLVRGVALEYSKLGRLTLESDFEHFHELVKPTRG
jgi:hypothetical protein